MSKKLYMMSIEGEHANFKHVCRTITPASRYRLGPSPPAIENFPSCISGIN